VKGGGVCIFVIPTRTRQQEDPGGNNNTYTYRFFSIYTFHSPPYILLERVQYIIYPYNIIYICTIIYTHEFEIFSALACTPPDHTDSEWRSISLCAPTLIFCCGRLSARSIIIYIYFIIYKHTPTHTYTVYNVHIYTGMSGPG